MIRVVEEIESLATPILENEGFFLIEVVLRGQRNNQVLEIFVDSEKDVTAEMCALINRALSVELDRKNIVQGKYTLVVSSPGVDRPLKFPMQYMKNTGRKLQVIFQDGPITKTIQGTLTSCTDTNIQLDTEKNLSYTVPYDAIVEAKVSLPW